MVNRQIGWVRGGGAPALPRLQVLIICIMSTAACRQNKLLAEPPAAVADAAHLSHTQPADLSILPDTFDELYPIFCQYRSMPAGQKGGLWRRKYYGRWVRWSGTVRSFTDNGLTIRQRPETLTFDFSLRVDGQALKKIQRELKIGEKVEFIARLDSYDDVFAKIYLTHAAVSRAPLGAR